MPRTVGRVVPPPFRATGVRVVPPFLWTVGREVFTEDPRLRTEGRTARPPLPPDPPPGLTTRLVPVTEVPPVPPPPFLTFVEGRAWVGFGVGRALRGAVAVPGRRSSTGRFPVAPGGEAPVLLGGSVILLTCPDGRALPVRGVVRGTVWGVPLLSVAFPLLDGGVNRVADPLEGRLCTPEVVRDPVDGAALLEGTAEPCPGAPGVVMEDLGWARRVSVPATPGCDTGLEFRTTIWGVPTSPTARSLNPKWAKPRLGCT